jgi:NADPH-dependent 2,4-dienoyl-CoA reductase/sulfur reductase-like enzyme/rubrerythrin
MSKRWICSVCGHIEKGASAPLQCPSCGAPFTAFELRERNPLAKFRKIEVVDERPAGFRYVIVGNSAAGRAAARAIGAMDDDGAVTIIAEEDNEMYARPMLPDLIGGADRDTLFGVSEAYSVDAFELLVDPAVALDPAGKTVTCASGRQVEYDALLLATGSAPRQIPWPGSEVEGVHYFRTLADAEAISAAAASAKHAVVIGGGLLGLEFVRAFHARGVPTTILVRGDAVGFPGLDREAGEVIHQALLDWGVEVALEEEAESFTSSGGKVSAVKTSGSRTIECDVVGIAVGAAPRVQLAEEAGLDVDRGVLVDERFRTSNADICAAGDVAQVADILWSDRRVITSWRNAGQQGEAAGVFMAGGTGSFPGAMATNYQLAAGLPFCAIGISNPPEPEGFEIEMTVDADARTCRKLVMRDGELVGAALVGDLSEAADLEARIRERFSPDENASTGASGRKTTPAPVEETPADKEMTDMHKMTEENLQAAFAGESQAHMKYKNFAKKADEEGKGNVARLFRATSFAEEAHASHHLEVLGGIESTSQNLGEAMAGEDFEAEEMYPAYMAVADAQDEDEAYEAFDYAIKAEVQHRDLYQRAKQAVDAGGDAQIEDIQVCSFCGHTIEGDAPDKCPICGSPKKNFVKF